MSLSSSAAESRFPGPPSPEPRVERVGRWLHRVWIADGMLCYGPDGYGWLVLGRRRALRKAVREFRRYLGVRARVDEGMAAR